MRHTCRVVWGGKAAVPKEATAEARLVETNEAGVSGVGPNKPIGHRHRNIDTRGRTDPIDRRAQGTEIHEQTGRVASLKSQINRRSDRHHVAAAQKASLSV